TPTKPVVQVVHNSFVSAEKFMHLRGLAEQEGVTLQHLNVENSSPQSLRDAIASATLAVLDVPRPNDRTMVTQHLEPAFLHADTPRLTVGGGRPAWEHLQPRTGGTLAALYAAGGEDNFRRFFALARTIHEGGTPPPGLLAAPERLP